MRKQKRVVRIGSVEIGGELPVAVQSMTKTKTADIANTVKQIHRLERAGCELIRCAVVNRDDVAALKKIKKSVTIPLIADIHFDYRLALGAINAGVDKIRINPGNIGERWKIEEIIRSAKGNDIPIRVGVNSGSLPKKVLSRYAHPTVGAIVDSVESAISVFEDNNFTQLVISAKGVDVRETVEVYQMLHKQFSFPLHIGITEAGLPLMGAVKSAVGLGIILHGGIGDTLRVSLTADPVQEVVVAYVILGALGIRTRGPILISCPMCGRCEVDMEHIARVVDKRLKKYSQFIKVAVMGCVVNGPGEAREADFGIACGKGVGAVFARGKEIKRVKENKLVEALFEVIDENTDNR
ncbi:MAG: flavodoxin-dependent (E)-4-hydroxy-3-methylbut-2-enyl-diphosphate synthase [candidate division WOR-3 bacterium]|nr:MAG: flavodoxin-dependent (E)-4-hydroxy-3-methylbut-2-enyl-diphosphate synthase [candidate division WOR-3 bacterium]